MVGLVQLEGAKGLLSIKLREIWKNKHAFTQRTTEEAEVKEPQRQSEREVYSNDWQT